MENEKFIKKIMWAMAVLLIVSVFVGGCALKKESTDEKETSSATEESQSISSESTVTSSTASQTSSENSTVSSSAITKTSETAKISTTTTTKKNTNPKVKVVDGISYVDGVMIVNKSYSLPASYNPGCSDEADEAYYKMKAAAKEDGVSLFVVSDFRSYETQESIYNRYVSEDGKAAADRYSARPGHSEHQTGLAYDLNSLSSSFGETTEGKWLANHCWEYGFIIRYPKGKESITGYMYEPWHVRYLGEKTAKAVYESGLTLEEYLGIDSVYSD